MRVAQRFAGQAADGYCPSKSQFIWGMRPVLLADPKGVPVGDDLVGPKTGEEGDAVLQLDAAHAGNTVFADGGFSGCRYGSSMELIGMELIAPAKHKLSQRPAAEIAKARNPAV